MYFRDLKGISLMNFANKKKILMYACYIIVALPVFISLFYTLPNADDFSFPVTLRNLMQDMNYLQAVLVNSYKNYMGWEGTYTGTFLADTIAYGITLNLTGLHIVLAIIYVLFLLGIILFVKKVLEFVFGIDDKKIQFLVSLFVEISVLNMSNLRELIYWLDGAVFYTVPLICALFGSYLLMKWDEKKSAKYLIISSILGFVASGGSLDIVVFNCGFYFGICFVYFIDSKKLIDRYWIPFIVALLGGLCNAVAPGNFRRHGFMEDTSINPVSSLIDSFSLIDNYYKRLLTIHIAGVLAVLCIIIICTIGLNTVSVKKHTLRRVILFAIYAFLLNVVSVFPVLTGYSIDNLDSCLRALNVSETGVTIGIFLSIAALACWIAARFSIQFKSKEIAVICICLMLVAINGGYLQKMTELSGDMTYQALYELASGKMRANYKQYKGFLETLENAEPGSDVVLTGTDYGDSIIAVTKLDTNNGDWEAASAASFYKVNSITLNLSGNE